MVCKLMHGSAESFMPFSRVGTCGTSKVMGKRIFREKSRITQTVWSWAMLILSCQFLP